MISPVSAAVRRCQLAMVAVYIAVEIGDDSHCGAQTEFDAALDVLIARPPADAEDAATRLRCLAQIGETYLEDTWTAGRVYAALRTIAAGLDREPSVTPSDLYLPVERRDCLCHCPRCCSRPLPMAS